MLSSILESFHIELGGRAVDEKDRAMTVRDWLIGLGIALFLSSILLWGIPWNRFIESSRRTRRVNKSEFRRTALRVAIGTLCSGLVLALLGFIANGELDVSAFAPIVLLLGFAAFPAGFAILITSMFILKAAALRALYKADGQPESGEKRCNSC